MTLSGDTGGAAPARMAGMFKDFPSIRHRTAWHVACPYGVRAPGGHHTEWTLCSEHCGLSLAWGWCSAL